MFETPARVAAIKTRWYGYEVARFTREVGLLCVGLTLSAAAHAADGGTLVGTAAPAWTVEHWLNSSPLTLEELRGDVVLVRWWTAPECPFCTATAPSLNDFHARYAQRGLRVIGFYHHKSRSALNTADVERYTKLFGFQFPVAIDPEWTTLRTWWLGSSRRYTSVSFLIDRRGIIRFVHPGGQYVKGDRDHTALEAHVEQLLSEPLHGRAGGH